MYLDVDRYNIYILGKEKIKSSWDVEKLDIYVKSDSNVNYGSYIIILPSVDWECNKVVSSFFFLILLGWILGANCP